MEALAPLLDAADPAALAAFAAALLATGALAGVLAGLLGVGGGIVIVPVLFHLAPLLGIDEAVRMHMAVGTSLATIIATSVVSARAHHRRGSLDPALLGALAPGVVLGVLAGTWVGARSGGATLTAVFGVVALAVAAHMALRRDDLVVADALPGAPLRHVLGAVIGGFSVVMGIGGGTLSVPLLTLCGQPIRRAVGTAAAIGLIISLPGTLGFMAAGWGLAGRPPGSLGYVNVIGVALIVPATMVAAPLGARLAHTLPPRLLRRAFALFLALTAVRMLASLG